MDQLPQGQSTQQPVQPVAPQAASPVPPAQPAQPVQIPFISQTLTPPTPSSSKLKNPKLWIGAGVGLLIIIVVSALFMGKPELFPGRVPTEEEIAGCARLTTSELCQNPRFSGICEWVKSEDGTKQYCQAVGIGAVPPAAEAPPAETPPQAEEPAPAAEVPTAEPQAEETAAARVQCESLTQALCGNPRYADRCEWATLKDGKQQCQAKGRVAVQPAEAPPPAEEPAQAAEVPTAEPQAEERAAAPTRCGDLTTQSLCQNPRFADRCAWVVTSKDGKPQSQCQPMQAAAAPSPAEARPAETPAAEVPLVEEPKEKEKVEIVAVSPQPVTSQPVAQRPVAPQPVSPQPITTQPTTSKETKKTPESTILQPAVPTPATRSSSQEEGRIRDLENLVASLQQQLPAAQNSNNDAQINALNTQIANLIAEMNNLRQAAGQPVVVNVVAPPAPAAPEQAAPAPAPAPAVSAPSSGGGTEIIAVAVKDAQKKKEKKPASEATAESDSASAPAVSDGGGAIGVSAAKPVAVGTAASGASSASAASASSARATHGAFIQGRTGPGILLYPIFVAAANGMYFLLRKKKR